MPNKLCVVLSTYNGEKYLKEQVLSLENQSLPADLIFIRDDGSTDGTSSVVASLLEEFHNIEYVEAENVGWKLSFVEALKATPGYSWYAFCDQDDYWLPSKLEAALGHVEKFGDSSTPVLYAGNVTVAGPSLEPMFRFNREPSDIEARSLPMTLTRDGMSGGLTYLFNSVARDYLLACPAVGVTGHDRLLMLICKAFGVVQYDFEPHVLYRQHGNNVYGGIVQSDTRNRLKRLMDYLDENDKRPELASGLLDLDSKFGGLASHDRDFLMRCASYKDGFLNKARMLAWPEPGGYSWKHDVKLRLKIICGTY